MLHMPARTHLTIAAALGLIAVSLAVALALRTSASPLVAVLTYFLVYWTGCTGFAACLAPTSSLRTLYRSKKGYSLARASAWIPAVATLVVAFIPSAALLSAGALLAVAFFAFVNGACEELFWRATFVAVFPAALPVGLLSSCVLFTLAHAPLLLLPGVSFSGGPTALLLGAAVLGGLWAWLAWRDRDLRSITAAHVATNFFAFAGIVAENWAQPQCGVTPPSSGRPGVPPQCVRVLLTRARQGMVLFIPPGESTDPTRSPAYYDCTFDYMTGLGIPTLS